MILRNRKNLRPVTNGLVVLVLSSAVALSIAFGHTRLFSSMLNQCVVLHPVLLRNGFIQYQHIADHKTPLLPLSLSWILPLFNGDAVSSARIIHALFVCVMVMTSMLWAYRASDLWAMLATGAYMLAWSGAFGLWATMYYDFVLGLFYLLVFALLMWQTDKMTVWRIAAVGLISGIAILVKQHAVLLVLPIAILLVWQFTRGKTSARKLVSLAVVYSFASLLPIAVYACFHYGQSGSLRDLFYWTLLYNIAGGYRSGAALAPTPAQVIAMLPAFLMLIPFAGSVALSSVETKPSRGTRTAILVFFLIAIVPLYPRYSARHWAAAFPFAAVLSGIACADLVRGWQKQKTQYVQLLVYIAVVVYWLAIASLAYLPSLKDSKPPRLSEYTELIALAEQLENRIPVDGGLALLPTDEGNSNLYYILKRQPPHYWAMHNPWHLNEYAVGRWLAAMEEEKPRTLLYFPGRVDIAKYAPELLEYAERHYEQVDTILWNNSQVQIMIRRKGH